MGQVLKLHEFASETDARISASVRALISGRGLQPAEVGLIVGVTKASMYNKLGGKAPWKASEVEALARYFEIRISDLYDGLGGRFGPPGTPPAAVAPVAQRIELPPSKRKPERRKMDRLLRIVPVAA